MRKIIWWLVNNTLEKQAMQPFNVHEFITKEECSVPLWKFQKKKIFENLWIIFRAIQKSLEKKCSGDICNIWKGPMIFGRVQNHAFIFSYLSKTQGKLWLPLKYSRWQFSVCINLVICTELQFCTCVHTLYLSFISTALFIANQKGIMFFQVYY